MSQEQLAALLTSLKDDIELQVKFKGAQDVDAALEIAKNAGFDVNKADLESLENATELSDEELEGVTGGWVGLAIAGGVVLATMLICPKRWQAGSDLEVIDVQSRTRPDDPDR